MKRKRQMPVVVRDYDHFKHLVCDMEVTDFFVALNGGFRSSKYITEGEEPDSFEILNLIDDTTQVLTKAQLFDRDYTNIGFAIDMGSLFAELDNTPIDN